MLTFAVVALAVAVAVCIHDMRIHRKALVLAGERLDALEASVAELKKRAGGVSSTIHG